MAPSLSAGSESCGGGGETRSPVTNAIMFEELAGPHHTPEVFWVCFANLPWLGIPLVLIARLWNEHQPFERSD